MFRDLKEYQEIAKIYAEKVSKPENLDERVRGGGVQSAPTIKPATPPQKGFGGGVGNKTNRRGSGARNNRKKPEKKMSNIPVIDGPVNNPEYGQNMSRDEKDLNPPKPEVKTPDPKPSFKDKFIKKDKGVGFVKRGTPGAQRAENKEKNKMRAQEMAKARIAAKKEGTASPQMSAADRAKAMAKARLAKKASMEEYTPYDFVLEYLLYSEQAATIEEANYVMTEMDAETIQGIVEEQKKNLMKE